jgi:hypothetical protein
LRRLATVLEEKARENPDTATASLKHADKLRGGGMMLETLEATRAPDTERSMTTQDQAAIDYLSERVTALEAANRKRAAFWDEFWVWALCLLTSVFLVRSILTNGQSNGR